MRRFARLPGEEEKGQQRGIPTLNESALSVEDVALGGLILGATVRRNGFAALRMAALGIGKRDRR
jgi:hypothetical protein